MQMAKFYPTSDVDLGPARIAVIESVTGSFGEQCTLAQFQSNPDAFVIVIADEAPVLIIAHDDVEQGAEGWVRKSEPYNIDGAVPSLIDQILTVAQDLGAEPFEVNVLHVANFDATNGDLTHSSWPVVGPTPLDISMSLEGGSGEPSGMSPEQIDKLCQILSGAPVGDNLVSEAEASDPPATVEDALSQAFAEVGEAEPEPDIILAGGADSETFDLDRIKRTPNVLDEQMIEVLSEMLTKMGFASAVIDDRAIEVEDLLASDRLLPALIVTTAHQWSLLLQARPNIPGFFVRLRTDKNAMLGYRVEAIHSNSAGNIPVSIFQCLQPIINKGEVNHDLMRIIDVFHDVMRAYSKDVAISQAS